MQTACENCDTQVAATNEIRQALDKAQASELETTRQLARLRIELRQVAAERDELRHRLSEVRAQIARLGKNIELWTGAAAQPGAAAEVGRG